MASQGTPTAFGHPSARWWTGIALIISLAVCNLSLSAHVLVREWDSVDPHVPLVIMRRKVNTSGDSDIDMDESRPSETTTKIVDSQPISALKIPEIPSPPTVMTTSRDSFIQEIDTYFKSIQVPASATQWIRDYLIWHRDIRLQFPDDQLLVDPQAPRVMIAWYEPGHQGGLTDRSKCLGSLLKEARDQDRVLFLKWFQAPRDLETFLEPRFLNFSLPYHPTTANQDIMERSYVTGRRGPTTKDRVFLRHLITECEYYASPFHVFWHVLFQPAPLVQQAIDDTMASLELQPNQFDAVHARVTHPAFRGKVKFGDKLKAIDHRGSFEFKDEIRERAIMAAIHGIQCAQWIGNTTTSTNQTRNESIYFFADSQDLVRAMVADQNNTLKNASDVLDSEISNLQSQVRIVGRSNANVTHLLNKDPNITLDAYVSAFVDLYVASQARCLSLGVGNYAYLSAKIKAGPVCWVRHQVSRRAVAKRWGMLGAATEIPACGV